MTARDRGRALTREERIVAQYEAEGSSWPLAIRMVAHVATCRRCIAAIIRNRGLPQ